MTFKAALADKFFRNDGHIKMAATVCGTCMPGM